MNLIENPSLEELRQMAKGEERTTIYGSASYITKLGREVLNLLK